MNANLSRHLPPPYLLSFSPIKPNRTQGKNKYSVWIDDNTIKKLKRFVNCNSHFNNLLLLRVIFKFKVLEKKPFNLVLIGSLPKQVVLSKAAMFLISFHFTTYRLSQKLKSA